MSVMTTPRAIDPFAPAPDGRYADDVVVVRYREGLGPRAGEQLIARTPAFAVGREGSRLLVLHELPTRDIDNDLAALLSRELFDPGWVTGADTFERLLTGVVLTAGGGPETAWERFYRNTLDRLEELMACLPLPWLPGAEGTLTGFAPVYARAEALVADAGGRSVADIGSCFGFFPLRLAGAGRDVIASDLSEGTCRLMARMGERLHRPLDVIACDGAGVPRPDGSVDTVTVLHVLEHVPESLGDRIVTEALRLARRRVIVAVPLEPVPDATYGHVRTLDPAGLAALADRVAPHATAAVSEHHGAWLTLDR